MENQALREKYNRITEKIKAALSANRSCIAAYLLGSTSHDQLWEWSDLQIAVILDDGYKGTSYYPLYEDDVYLALNIYTLSAFQKFIQTARFDDFMWKAFSKSNKLFSKNRILDEWMEDAFFIGEVDRQKEMLLGFSGAVYYLNKAEKNFYIKENIENVLYFIPQIAENIAWIEIFKNREIPEREIIPQGRKLNPAVFEKIYDPLFQGMAETSGIKNILEHCVSYLTENTEEVYQPVLAYMEKRGSLEGFCYETRPHGFGINYEWLVRCGIARRYGRPEKIPFLAGAERLGYRWADAPQ